MKDLIKQNYEVTRERGLITDKTTPEEFINKMWEELEEFEMEITENIIRGFEHVYKDNKGIQNNKKNISYELADFVMVGFAFAKHYNIDLLQAIEDKIEINRQRI